MQTINILFMRHKPTDEQLQKIGTEYLDLSQQAAINISSISDAEDIYEKIIGSVYIDSKVIVNLYGVIPVPLRHLFNENSSYLNPVRLCTFEAFNVQRSVESEKPTFKFKGWLMTGTYDLI